jgi:gamma-glutamyltranspeptidase / glutathione hydrolase
MDAVGLACRWACPARSPCWPSPTASTAACPGRALFEPAIALAEQGFAVSPRLHTLLAAESALKADPVAAAYFYRPDGAPHPVGHVLKNPELAAVLREIAAHGPRALHEGPVAQAIVDKVRLHPRTPGTLSAGRPAALPAPRARSAVHRPHGAAAKALRVCGFPPPSSGAIAVGQILGLLARTPQGVAPLAGTPGADWLHAYTEASRLAFADRAQYLADPDFVAAPAGRWDSLLSRPTWTSARADHAAARAPQVGPGRPAARRWPTRPCRTSPSTAPATSASSTRFGNALAMTTTIEAGFGARLMVNTGQGRRGGFLLNNQLTDFSFAPTDAQGRPVANRVEPGKRPRSSMSPTLVFDKATASC